MAEFKVGDVLYYTSGKHWICIVTSVSEKTISGYFYNGIKEYNQQIKYVSYPLTFTKRFFRHATDIIPQRTTQERVLDKIKYLDEKYEKRMKEKLCQDSLNTSPAPTVVPRTTEVSGTMDMNSASAAMQALWAIGYPSPQITYHHLYNPPAFRW